AIANIDLADAGQRWPAFTQAARDVGFRTSHALPLKLRSQVIGSLNLFSAAQRPLSDARLAVVQGLADIATIGLLHERALTTRGCSRSNCRRRCRAGSSSSRRRVFWRPAPERV